VRKKFYERLFLSVSVSPSLSLSLSLSTKERQIFLNYIFLIALCNRLFSEIRPTRITRAYMLAAAYCSTLGGTGTLVGTGTNLTFKGIYETTFPEAEGITFTAWLFMSFPQMVFNAILTWFYLLVAFMGFLRPKSKDAQLARIGPEGVAMTNQVKRPKTMKYKRYRHKIYINRKIHWMHFYKIFTNTRRTTTSLRMLILPGHTRQIQRSGPREFSRVWNNIPIFVVRVPLDISQTWLYGGMGRRNH